MRQRAAIVGRDRELTAFESAVSRDAGLILVTGDAGIGKTRLVVEVLERQRSLGTVCLTGGCVPLSQPLPLLPVADALRELTRHGGELSLDRVLAACPPYVRPALSRLLPELATEPAAADAGPTPAQGWDRERLFAAVAQVLREASQTAPLTLVLEDLHWADQSTLDLLTYLERSLDGTKIALVVTCRSDEVDVPESVQAWLSNARRTALSEIRLDGLDHEQVAMLVTGLLERAVSSELVEELASRTAGNPFFVEQLAAAMSAQPQAGTTPLPHGLADFLTARIRRVGAHARTVLDALAVLGRPADEQLLRAITDLPEQQTRTALRELHSAKLLTDREHAEGYAVRHALLAEAVTLDLLPGERQDLHARSAEALEARLDRDTTAEVAAHWRAADRPVDELRATVATAKAAAALYAFDEAAAFWERAIAICEQLPGASAALGLNELDIYLSAARAVVADSTRFDEGAAIAERAFQRFANASSGWDAARLRSEVSGFRRVRDVAAAVPLLQDALVIFETLPPSAEFAFALNNYAGYVKSHHRDRVLSAALLARAIEVSDAAGDIGGAITALSILASIRFVAGDVAAGFELLSRGRTLGEKLQAADQDLLPALDLAAAESDACLRTGRLEEAERLALNGVALAPACGRERSFTAEILLANAVEALLERGDIDRASHLMATVPVDPDNESVWVRLTSWIEIDVVAGRVDSARDRMRRVTGIKDADLSLDRETSQLAVNVLLGGGEPGEAIDLVLDSGRRYVGTDEDLFCGELLVLGARAAADLADGARARRDQAGVADALTRLEQVEALAESMGGRPFTDHPYIVRIPSDRAQWHAERQRARGVIDPDAWCTSAEAWEGLGRPHRAAYAWWRCAETHLMSGAGAAAAAEPLRRGARLAAGFVPIMAAIDALARRAKIQLDRPSTAATHGDADEGSTRSEPIRVDPYGLTERERLVLALVAAGRTNTQIGAELFISPKTASVHVTNILRKLGVDNRTQAASTAERAGILA